MKYVVYIFHCQNKFISPEHLRTKNNPVFAHAANSKKGEYGVGIDVAIFLYMYGFIIFHHM